MKQIIYEYLFVALSIVAGAIALTIVTKVLFGPETQMALAIRSYLGGIMK